MDQIDIAIRRGDDESFEIDLLNADEQPVDLANLTVWFTIKDYRYAYHGFVDMSDSLAYVQAWWSNDGTETVSHLMSVRQGSSLVNGLLTVDLTPEHTSILPIEENIVYDVQVKLPNGKIKTWLSGQVTVEYDVTQRTGIV